jgi:hypothetical protein
MRRAKGDAVNQIKMRSMPETPGLVSTRPDRLLHDPDRLQAIKPAFSSA